MKKTRLLGLALAGVIAIPASIPAFAANSPLMYESSDINGLSIGIVGSFNNWGSSGEDDIPMNDNDNDGIYEGIIEIPSVTEDMISESITDNGTGEFVSRGFSGVQFKIRTNNSWSNNWGDYEPAYNRTYNSQTSCCVETKPGMSLTVKVWFDTTSVEDQSVQDEGDRFLPNDYDSFYVWPVRYEVIESKPVTKLTNTSTISSYAVPLGSSVMIYPSSDGTDKKVKYSIYYKKSSSSVWTAIKNPTYENKFYPKAITNYDIKVIAKDADGAVSKKDFSVKVYRPIENTSSLSKDTIKLGEKVKIRCSAKNGRGDYYYSIYCKKSGAKKWSKLIDFSPRTAALFTPASATKYDIRIYAYDDDRTPKSKTLTLTVTK